MNVDKLVPGTAIELLDKLHSQLEDLQSGRKEAQLNDDIWCLYEAERKAIALWEKPQIVAQMTQELTRARSRKGLFLKQKRDLEQSITKAITDITTPLIANVKAFLNSEIANLQTKEFANLVKTESATKGTVMVSTNSEEVAKGHSILRSALNDIEQYMVVPGRDFVIFLKELEKKLSTLNLEGELLEMKQEDFTTLRDRIRPPLKTEPTMVPLDGEVFLQGQETAKRIEGILRGN